MNQFHIFYEAKKSIFCVFGFIFRLPEKFNPLYMVVLVMVFSLVIKVILFPLLLKQMAVYAQFFIK